MATTMINGYRSLRSQGWRAQEALRHVRDDARLSDAEEAGLIRFRWEWDDEFDLDNYSDIPELIEEAREKLERDYWEARSCIAEVPSRTVRPFADVDAWEVSGSLWGVVGPFDRTDKDYRRSVEIDLAYESGVLA
jgi:hypothetical protein